MNKKIHVLDNHTELSYTHTHFAKESFRHLSCWREDGGHTHTITQKHLISKLHATSDTRCLRGVFKKHLRVRRAHITQVMNPAVGLWERCMHAALVLWCNAFHMCHQMEHVMYSRIPYCCFHNDQSQFLWSECVSVTLKVRSFTGISIHLLVLLNSCLCCMICVQTLGK